MSNDSSICTDNCCLSYHNFPIDNCIFEFEGCAELILLNTKIVFCKQFTNKTVFIVYSSFLYRL